MKSKRLSRDFYARNTHTVAKALLGKILVHRVGNQNVSGRICEVEAYVGEDDLACHAARGRTPRTETMYGEPGHAYIYLIYGMYACLNIVTEKKDMPAAVLIRALEPLQGITTMIKNRARSPLPPIRQHGGPAEMAGHLSRHLTSGPGKLTQALAITRALNGADFTTNRKLFVQGDGFRVAARAIATSPRIGVAYAGPAAAYPWRYYLKDSAFVTT